MDDYLAISALQHYAYCPRQFALIHVEQVWAENHFTAEGRILHERVDSQQAERRGAVRYERSVLIRSEQYRIQGKMDLLEIHDNSCYYPVEYKRGKPKIEHWDRLQLCAQALCIEEMRGVHVDEGAIWYWEPRKREQVKIDDALRQETICVIDAARALLVAGNTPRPIDKKQHCRACSLKTHCQPALFKNDWSAAYVESIGQ